MDKSEESPCEFIIACRDSSKELDFLKKAFNEMRLFVLPPVTQPRVFRVFLWRDTVFGAMLVDEITDCLRSIGFVRHEDRTA